MRIRLLLGLSFVALVVASACGSDDSGGGPPGGSGGSGGSDPDADDDEIPPAPGTCRPVCCSSADCNGESCNQFDSSYGTLGVCAGSSWGTTDAGSDPDAGPGGQFPPGCWTLNDATCNPLTNEGCSAGDACDFGGDGDPEFEPVVGCFGGDNTQGPGETCDAALGPFCIPGFHCVEN